MRQGAAPSAGLPGPIWEPGPAGPSYQHRRTRQTGRRVRLRRPLRLHDARSPGHEVRGRRALRSAAHPPLHGPAGPERPDPFRPPGLQPRATSVSWNRRSPCSSTRSKTRPMAGPSVRVNESFLLRLPSRTSGDADQEGYAEVLDQLDLTASAAGSSSAPGWTRPSASPPSRRPSGWPSATLNTRRRASGPGREISTPRSGGASSSAWSRSSRRRAWITSSIRPSTAARPPSPRDG